MTNGDRVWIFNDDTLPGKIVGQWEKEDSYIVELDKALWTRNGEMNIRLVVVYKDNLRKVNNNA